MKLREIMTYLFPLCALAVTGVASAKACWDPEHHIDVSYKGIVKYYDTNNVLKIVSNALIAPAWYFKDETTLWTPSFIQKKNDTATGKFNVTGRGCMSATQAHPAKGFIRIWAPGFAEKIISANIYGKTVDLGVVILSDQEKRYGWAGLRESFYGATSDGFSNHPDKEVFTFPSVAKYTKGIKETSTPFVTMTYRTSIWNVTEVDYDTKGIIMQFAKPANIPNDPLFTFTTSLGEHDFQMNHDAYLNKFDQDSFSRIFLGIEPGHANITKTIKLILDKYKSHASVAGISIDTEFYNYAGEWDDKSQWPAHPCANPDKPESLLGCNEKVGNDLALYWDMLIKSYNPQYRLILKHWNPEALPPKYRGDIIFATDTQETGSLANHKSEFKIWGTAFSGNDVMLQAGYPADWSWIKKLSPDTTKLPRKMADEMRTVLDKRQGFGIIWVDFSMRKTFPDIFN